MAVWVIRNKLDCQTCPVNLRVERGCEQDSPIPGKWQIEGVSYQRCPRSLLTKDTLEYLYAYSFFRNHILPNSGGWLDQPKKFRDAMLIIEDQVAKMDEQEGA